MARTCAATWYCLEVAGDVYDDSRHSFVISSGVFASMIRDIPCRIYPAKF